MKIVQVHNRYREAGGEDVVVRSERDLLLAAGHEVGRYEVENPEGTVATARSLLAAPWSRGQERRLRSYLSATKADVVHIHNTWFSLTPSVVAAAHRSGAAVVVSVHNYRLVCPTATLYRDGAPCTDCVGRVPWPGVRHRCYRASVVASGMAATTIEVHRRRGTWLHDVDVALVPSSHVGGVVESELPPGRTYVKPNPVGDPGPRDAAPSRSREVLFAGRLVEEKGVRELAASWAAAERQGMQLVVAGDGPARSAFVGCPDAEVIGHVAAEEVRRRMLGARAVVVPSRWAEPFGLVAVEAMAAGAPVLTSGEGALREIVGESAGWSVDVADVTAFAPALGRLSADEAVDRAGEAGRARYLAAFTPERSLAALEDAYAIAIRVRRSR